MTIPLSEVSMVGDASLTWWIVVYSAFRSVGTFLSILSSTGSARGF